MSWFYIIFYLVCVSPLLITMYNASETKLCDVHAYRSEHQWRGTLSIASADRSTNHGTRCLLRLLKSSKLQSPQRVNYPTGYLWLGYSLPSLAREQRQIKKEHADREKTANCRGKSLSLRMSLSGSVDCSDGNWFPVSCRIIECLILYIFKWRKKNNIWFIFDILPTNSSILYFL